MKKIKAFVSAKPKLALIVGVIVLVILVVVVSKTAKAIKRNFSKVKPNDAADGSKPELTQAEIDSIARSQIKAIDRPGTSLDPLFSSLEGLNGADLRRVFNQVGTVKYNSTFGVISTLFANELDLFGIYREELQEEENQKKMQAIWDKAGMKIF
jgi:hypothetical protein